MSADNWAYCPRCTQHGQARLDQRAAAVQASYGKIPVEEFDEARRQHAAAVKAFEQRDQTFREDYEISGAETGAVTVGYSGSCTKCKLSLSFNFTEPIPGLD
jgi:hypothetical protein